RHRQQCSAPRRSRILPTRGRASLLVVSLAGPDSGAGWRRASSAPVCSVCCSATAWWAGSGGFVCFFGLFFLLGCVGCLAVFIWRWFQRRHEPAYAGSLYRDSSPVNPFRSIGLGGGSGSSSAAAQRSDNVGIGNADYDAFERLLGEIQTAYSNEDINALRA